MNLIVVASSVVLTWLFILAITAFMPDQPFPAWPEIIATATGLSCVWFTRLENVWCWPVGAISAALMAWTFFGYDLPGQAWLQIAYFLPIQFYGWYLWLAKKPDGTAEVSVSWMDAPGQTLSLAVGLGLMVAIGYALHAQYGGDLSLRMWDASIVAASIVAQFLLNRKRLESWWLWLVPVNVSSVILYVSQGAYLYSLMYVVFLVHAILAIVDWSKKCRLG